jgi:hypothetical protein
MKIKLSTHKETKEEKTYFSTFTSLVGPPSASLAALLQSQHMYEYAEKPSRPDDKESHNCHISLCVTSGQQKNETYNSASTSASRSASVEAFDELAEADDDDDDDETTEEEEEAETDEDVSDDDDRDETEDVEEGALTEPTTGTAVVPALMAKAFLSISIWARRAHKLTQIRPVE